MNEVRIQSIMVMNQNLEHNSFGLENMVIF
jgi:hypothetical protein